MQGAVGFGGVVGCEPARKVLELFDFGEGVHPGAAFGYDALGLLDFVLGIGDLTVQVRFTGGVAGEVPVSRQVGFFEAVLFDAQVSDQGCRG